MADDPQPVRSLAETSTSRSLLMQLKEGQPAAWQRLTALYAPLVYQWCRGMHLAEQDMPDVFQQVFQSVASHIQTFHRDRPGDTFRHWLRVITRNKVRDHFRRIAKQAQAAGGRSLAGAPGLGFFLGGGGQIEQREVFHGYRRSARQRAQYPLRGAGGKPPHALTGPACPVPEA